MPDIQRELFTWSMQQHPTVGMAVFALGLLYCFMGFRFYVPLLALTCSALGFGAGAGFAMASDFGDGSPMVGGIIGLLVGGVLPFASRRGAMMLVGAAVWAGLGSYLLTQFGMRGPVLLTTCGVLALLGAGFAVTCRQAPIPVLTALQGVALMVVGWVGLATGLAPSLGRTFVDWAAGWSLLVPLMLLMLFVTGYSYQAMNQRGDIRTGAA